MGRQLLDSGASRRSTYDVPEHRGHAVAPHSPDLVDRPKHWAVSDPTRSCPRVDGGLHPRRDRHGSHAATVVRQKLSARPPIDFLVRSTRGSRMLTALMVLLRSI